MNCKNLNKTNLCNCLQNSVRSFSLIPKNPPKGSLTRFPCHRANHEPYQKPTAVGTLACQTGSDHQSAAAAPPQSCFSEHSIFLSGHLQDYLNLCSEATQCCLRIRSHTRHVWFPIQWITNKWLNLNSDDWDIHRPSTAKFSMARLSPRLQWGGKQKPRMLLPVLTLELKT